jgi:hypothetical protein
VYRSVLEEADTVAKLLRFAELAGQTIDILLNLLCSVQCLT